MSVENTRLTCPDCGGSIQKIENDNVIEYRCRVGHAYSPQTALAVHAEREENTLWTAVVLLIEGADLADEIASRPAAENVSQLREISAAKRHLAETVRQVVLQVPSLAVDRK